MVRRCLLALLVTLGMAPPASALELGVQDDPVLYSHAWGNPQLTLGRAADLGADRIRVNLVWAESMPAEQAQASVEPESVDWDFSRLERLQADAVAQGLRLQVTLHGPAPAWASGDGAVSYVSPDPRAFAEFAAAAAAQFAGRIDRWSIWNEPNWHRFLQPAKSAPSRYRSLFRSGAAAIRAADPAARVLIGELSPGASTKKSTAALKFLRAITCSRSDWSAAKRCNALVADGFAMHPYNFARRPRDAANSNKDVVEIGSLSRLTKPLDKLRSRGALKTPGGVRMPLYLTEFGYFTSGPVGRDPQTHARWMAEAWQIAARNPRVRQLLQYGLIEPWPDEVTWRTAVMERDGTPREVYFALQRLAR